MKKLTDKIYIAESNSHPGFFAQEYFLPYRWTKFNSIEYIRKDALLEWLQKEYETMAWYYEKMKHVTGCVGDTSSSGKAEAYKEVIEKIESL